MADLTTLVIFGASGDLTRRKLVPSLFNLYEKGRLPGQFMVVGFALTDWDDEAFRRMMLEGMEELAGQRPKPEHWSDFKADLHYRSGSFTDAGGMARLSQALDDLEGGPANRLYYLATPPRFFPQIVANLGAAEMERSSQGWRRVVVEKPFGRDLHSAQTLNQTLHQVLREEQIYRMDHYLGKETLQNVLVFRFANTLQEPIWNRNYIDHVQITVAEAVDVGHRAGYYDQAGVLRDMFQNHMMQMLALVAMEPPASFEADAIRDEKVKLFAALRPMPEDLVKENSLIGQYRGYRQAEGVARNSVTATFAGLRVFVDNWRWQGVPFYLRSGKALQKKTSEIVIQFKEPPHVMFPLPEGKAITPNTLAICIQPHEGIHLNFEAKVPDTPATMRSVNMVFHYDDAFGDTSIPDAYERLLLDALQGDASLFTRSDGIEKAWRFMDPILRVWERQAEGAIGLYEPGSWGPREADVFIERDGRRWLHACED